MDSKDLIKLARLFDNFIELDSSRVRITDIVAIQRVEEANKHGGNEHSVMVVTPYGSFPDSTDYDTFNTRIKDTLELIKEQCPSNVSTSSPGHPRDSSGDPSSDQPEQSERKVIPLDTNPGKQERQTIISVGAQGAQGNLFDANTLQLADRADLCILDPEGKIVLAKAGEGSAVLGESVSGFIYSSGKYVMSFKDYPHKSATVSYSVKKKATL